VAKDLVRYDALKLVAKQLEDRIAIMSEKEQFFKNRLSSKDSIISLKQQQIDLQQDVIDANNKLKINGFVGVQTFQVSFLEPTLYFQTEVTIKKITVGARVFVQPNNPGGYGIIAEYKIF
jgi:PDZ domain-containing secreted protein